jgi:hypothetical protein
MGSNVAPLRESQSGRCKKNTPFLLPLSAYKFPFGAYIKQLMLRSVVLSEAKNLYDYLRDPHLHCIRSAVQVSLSLRESRLSA